MEVNIEKYHLKSTSFLDYLSESELAYVKSRMTRKEYVKGELLFREKSYSKGIYIVRKGKVKIFQSTSNGPESIVYIYKKGDFFGYRPIIGDELNPVSAAAIEAVAVSFIPREVFMTVLQKSPQLARKLLSCLSREFSVWINKMTVFSQYSVKERVGLALLILSKIYQRGDEDLKTVAIAINRDDFAGFVGTAKETLVRMLRNYKDQGIITSKGTNIYITKPGLLSNLVADL